MISRCGSESASARVPTSPNDRCVRLGEVFTRGFASLLAPNAPVMMVDGPLGPEPARLPSSESDSMGPLEGTSDLAADGDDQATDGDDADDGSCSARCGACGGATQEPDCVLKLDAALSDGTLPRSGLPVGVAGRTGETCEAEEPTGWATDRTPSTPSTTLAGSGACWT